MLLDLLPNEIISHIIDFVVKTNSYNPSEEWVALSKTSSRIRELMLKNAQCKDLLMLSDYFEEYGFDGLGRKPKFDIRKIGDWIIGRRIHWGSGYTFTTKENEYIIEYKQHLDYTRLTIQHRQPFIIDVMKWEEGTGKDNPSIVITVDNTNQKINVDIYKKREYDGNIKHTHEYNLKDSPIFTICKIQCAFDSLELWLTIILRQALVREKRGVFKFESIASMKDLFLEAFGINQPDCEESSNKKQKIAE